jgi:hypothetical protein
MRWAVSLALLGALSLAACGSKGGSKQLEGVWRGIGTDGVSQDRQDTANQFAKTMQLEFRGDSLTVIANGTKSASPFRVVKEDKTVVQIVPGTDVEGQTETFNLIDDQTMRWQALGTSTITFRKQN